MSYPRSCNGNPPRLLRNFAPADLSACLAIFDSNVPEFFVPAERAAFASFLAALPGPYLVVQQAGEVVACGGYAVEPGTATADLCWGMVLPTDERLLPERFARASKYHHDWILASVSGSANSLWLTEWLTEVLELRPGMRVLDLGCGRATSSIFLRREFGVQVWATDLWFNVSENLQRIRDAGVEDGVFPILADARALPFAAEFFDAVVSIDAFSYFGTDDLYLNYLARFVKPGGPMGIAGAGLMCEMDDPIPAHLREWWAQDQPWCLHSAAWWQQHLGRTGILEIESADTLPDGWRFWLDWLRLIAPDNVTEIRALEADFGSHIGYVRVVGRRRASAQLMEPVVSLPAQYEKRPLLRDSD
jgi:ubiquinone/menaquinone biosynthesis C-methylase UbiE